MRLDANLKPCSCCCPIHQLKAWFYGYTKNILFMNALYLIISLFGLGALVGLYLIALVLQKKETPKFVALIHGAFVATALVLLMWYAYNQHADLAETIIIFVVAALGGITLFVRDITKKSLPPWLAVGHAIIAVIGFLYLVIYACK
jgi:hypothetical protein